MTEAKLAERLAACQNNFHLNLFRRIARRIGSNYKVLTGLHRSVTSPQENDCRPFGRIAPRSREKKTDVGCPPPASEFPQAASACAGAPPG